MGALMWNARATRNGVLNLAGTLVRPIRALTMYVPGGAFYYYINHMCSCAIRNFM
jgi:hypothetical protein